MIDDERARAHFVAGESHFAAERWADAEREFALAYELSLRPEMLINLSRAQERNGELAQAIASLELLIAKHPTNPYRSEAEARIADMRRQLAAGVPEPTTAPVKQDPPPVVVAVAPPVQEPTPLPPVQLEPEPPKHHLWPPSVLTLSVGGAAIVSAAVAIGTGVRANNIYNDLDKRCPRTQCGGNLDDRDHGRALARTSTAFTFVSIALAGSAAVLWVYDVKRADKQSSVAWGIDGAGAQMRARF